MTNATVNIKAVQDGKPLEECVRHAPTPATKARHFQRGDKVRYQRQDRAGHGLTTVRGYIDSLTMTSCVIDDPLTDEDELVAASLDRVRHVR